LEAGNDDGMALVDIGNLGPRLRPGAECLGSAIHGGVQRRQ
jgi:hypothetical protein